MILVGAFLLGVAAVLPIVRVRLARRRARIDEATARIRGIPAAVVLLQIAVAAGHGPRAAIATVGGSRLAAGDLGRVIEDFSDVSRRLELGADLSDAVLAIDAVAAPSMVRVLDALRRAEVDGAALTLHLEFLVNDLRRVRAMALDVAAQRLTITLLFPLVLCILPAFILLAVVPLLLGALVGLPG